MCGKGSNGKTTNQTSTTTPDSQALDAYRGLLSGATTTAATPWNPATGQQVAGFTPDQQQAFANVRSGIAQPFIDNASSMATAGAGPVDGNISRYMNPWTNDVVNTTQADFDVQNNRQLSGVVGNARMAGSLGGDREAVAKALTSEAQSRTQAPIIAGLRSQGYNTALSAAQNDASRSLQGAGIMGQLAPLAYTDTNALLSTGNQQQGQDQRVLDASTANATAQSAYPFQTQQWLASLYGGLGPLMGSSTNSTGTTEGPKPNTWSQAAGIGIAALPYIAAANGGRIGYAHGGAVGGQEKGFADHFREIQELAHGFSAGGGISGSYVPSFEFRPSAGIQPHQMMSMGGDDRQKASDPGKEFSDTAKMATQGFQGIADTAKGLGTYLNTTQGPGGWSTTVDRGSTGANLMAGIQGMMGYARGGEIGATDDNDPGGTYVIAPDGGGIGERAPMPLMDLARERPMGGQMMDGPPALPVRDMPVRDVPADPGESHAPPPANIMGDPNRLNPTGGVGGAAGWQHTEPVRSEVSSMPQPGILQRFGNWVTSDEGKKFTSSMGAAMMANSGVGGKGTFGIHAGQGLQAGLEAQSGYQKEQREAEINRAKMDLANRAAQIKEAEEGRAAAMNPYDIAHKQAQTKALLATAANKEDPTQVFSIRGKVADSLGITGDARKYYVANGKLPEDKQLTSTELKIIDDSVKAVSAEDRVIRQLQRASELNKNAASGWGAQAEASLWAGLGIAGDRSKNTLELSNILSREAILDMSNTLKGASTDREMGEFQKLSGAESKDPEVRQRLIDNALREAELSKRIAEQRAEQVRGKTFFKPGGMTGVDGAAPSGTIPKPKSKEELSRLPSGAKFIDPEGNERVKP